MKALKLLLVAVILSVGSTSCSSVRVTTDYDKNTNFNQYKTYAFYKPGIDKAQISDLDKRRILRAIEANLNAKGMTKSENPDMLVSILTESSREVDVYQNYYGWGYNPWYWGHGDPYYNRAYSRTEGTLYIDLIDNTQKSLIWQGMGVGALNPGGTVDQKTERINKIVMKILDKYPPN